MNSTTLIQANLEDLKKLISEPIREEEIAKIKAKFNDRIISAEAVALIHDVHIETVYAYANSGDIKHLERPTNGKMKFRLGDVLFIDFKQLRLQLKNRL